MEQYITPDRIANSIMQNNDFNGYYLIVEGSKDYKLYSKFFNKNWKIKEAFGCENVKSVLNILSSRGFNQKIGIIDSDFNNILNTKCNIDGLFYTDDHDIEVMILKTKALDDVLNLFCKNDKIEGFIKLNGKSILETILNLSQEIGYLKLANKIYNLGLVFKPENPEGNQIKYKDFISEKTLSFLGTESLIKSIINYSINKTSKKLDKDIIYNKLLETRKKSYDTYQLVNGHDLTNILYILIKKILRSNTKMLNDFNCVEDSLILAYNMEYFKETKLYKDLLEWSESNNIHIMYNQLLIAG